MLPRVFRGNTGVFKAPPDWDALKYGPCADLPVLVQDGNIISVWRPTRWERIKILFGADILHSVVCADRPAPMALWVQRIW